MSESSPSENSPSGLPLERLELEENIQDPELHEKGLGEIDLSGVAYSLEKYNKQFSLGHLMARLFVVPVEREDEEDEKEDDESESKKIEEERHKKLEEILKKYRIDLSRTGLNMEPVDVGARIMGSGEDLSQKEMRFNLSGGKKFLNYLGEMHKDKLSESQIYGLKAVIGSLTRQLKNQYEISDPDDERAIELLGNLNKIIKEYEKIGLSELVVDLSRYSEVANKKYLREYLLVERGNLLAEVGGQNFGPSKWHTDNTEERYRKQYWGNALRIAEMIGKNKNAREFQGKVIQHLKESLKWAKRDLVKNQGDEIKGRTENYKIIIDEIYEKLEELEGE